MSESALLLGGLNPADATVPAAAGYGLLALWLVATAPALHLDRPAFAPLPR